MRILVVDDEKLLVKGVKFNLENEGYEVECAYDGATAVEMARNGRYDLIILDVMMPELDGQEACLRIREFSNVPIIMLTARSEDTDKIIGFECGADDYITKPFNPLELVARVKAKLRRGVYAGEVALVVLIFPRLKAYARGCEHTHGIGCHHCYIPLCFSIPEYTTGSSIIATSATMATTGFVQPPTMAAAPHTIHTNPAKR